MDRLKCPSSMSTSFNDNEDREHDDYYGPEDYEEREYYRNGWNEEQWERQRF